MCSLNRLKILPDVVKELTDSPQVDWPAIRLADVLEAKRRLAPVPPYLSRPTWARLSRQIAAFLRQRVNNALTLRAVVRLVDAEVRLSGGTVEHAGNALRRAVLEHPELDTLDRTNVVTRRLASEELIERLLGWLEEFDAEQ